MNKFLVRYSRLVKGNFQDDLLEQVEVVKKHIEYIKKLDRKGAISLCGLFPNNDAILIINAKSYDEVESYLSKDPIIIKKYYEFTIEEFMEANEDNNWLLDDL